MNEKDIAANITAFETTGKLLTHPHVPCTCCANKTTMFGSKPGDNLMKRIEKFGSLHKLLSTFKCRECTKGDAPVKAKAPVIKAKDSVAAVAPAASDVEYNSTSAAVAAAQMTKEDCAKVFVKMPNGKLDYWWKHPSHSSQQMRPQTGVTITHDDGRKEYHA